MAFLIKLIFRATTDRTLRRFRDQCKDPAIIQERLLQDIIRKNASSAFGRRHDFSALRTYSDFRKAVPIGSYQSLYPYIEAALNGVPSQLTVESPLFFAVTSGTTGSSKYIPVTKESKIRKSQLMRIWLSGLYRDHPSIFDGRILAVVSREVTSISPSGIPCGSESGHGYRNMPFYLQTLYSCPYEAYLIEDYRSRYYTLIRIAAGQNVRMIYALNPSTILVLARQFGMHTEAVIRDVRDGTLSTEFDVPDSIRKIIVEGLRPDPARAAALEKAARAGGGVLLPKHIWPEAPVLCCWKGGSVSLYLARFGRYFHERTPMRDAGYLASEHRGSVPLADQGDSGVLAVPTSVFEFLPEEERRSPSALLPAHALESGRRYFVFVTTQAGLYRYDMDDIIEVTGHYENTPLIRFVQKGKGVVSFTGEKVYEDQVVAAVEKAFARRHRRYVFITALGDFRDPVPTYVYLVEFDDPIDENEGRELLVSLDRELRERNVEYASKRDSLRLAGPVLRVVKRGEYEEYRRRQVQQGVADSQFKILKLTTDKKVADQFSFEQEIEMEQSL